MKRERESSECYSVTSLRTSKCMRLSVSCNAHQAHTWCHRHQVDPLMALLPLLPRLPRMPLLLVTLCSALLLLKTLCRAHYKLIIPVLYYYTHTHTHTDTHVLGYSYRCRTYTDTDRDRDRGTDAGNGARSWPPWCHMLHIRRGEIFWPLSQAKHETNNFYYASHCTNEQMALVFENTFI